MSEAFDTVWDDQRAFNQLLRTPPTNDTERAQIVKDFTLYITDELHELLKATAWKTHRRERYRANPRHEHDEMADIFKLVISLAQYLDMTPDSLIGAYWRKTRVVRQRYNEEWVREINGPTVLIDIDNVLCDYIQGLGAWLLHQCYRFDESEVHPMRVAEAVQQRVWLSGRTLGIRDNLWTTLKHEFRSSGKKATLPVFDDARPFLTWCRTVGYTIVLVTSRPIDRYPNIYTDTITWLTDADLPFDFIWWAHDKAERVTDQDVMSHVRFVVDDDLRYVDQFVPSGIPVFWLNRSNQDIMHTAPNVHVVRSLDHVMQYALHNPSLLPPVLPGDPS